MPERDIHKTDPGMLAAFMSQERGSGNLWQPEELGAILRHQLSAPVEFDLSGINSALAPKIRTLAASQGLLVRSFADLFFHPCPPLELLQLTKDFAKANRDHPDSPLPREIATLLYFTSITAALVKCGKRITGLDDAALGQGLQHFIKATWVDEPTKELLRQGLAHIAR